MREQHLDLLLKLHGDVVLLGLGDVAGVFVFLAGDGQGLLLAAVEEVPRG
ncbi:hypothetical protein PAA8504_03577 [Palleronia abyssalis]|uniref:Uncharacterized protein n=1 Tax=Palleronia abyssalis TaxID=1501240 RepID=A0A2R8C059_9RHOB|nr:hypothetical protein PAA8504_03577 [Palleronia abyssalis]